MDFKTHSLKTVSCGLISKFFSLFCHHLALIHVLQILACCFTVVASSAYSFSWPLGELFACFQSLRWYPFPCVVSPGDTEELWLRCSLCNLHTSKLTPSTSTPQACNYRFPRLVTLTSLHFLSVGNTFSAVSVFQGQEGWPVQDRSLVNSNPHSIHEGMSRGDEC